MRFNSFAKLILNVAVILIAAAARVFACSMCKANVTNAENAAEVATTINTAILILLAPTLVIIGGLVALVFKYRHYQYVNLTTSGSKRDAQQRQRDPAHRGLLLHSSEKRQGPSSLHD
jgi:predicted histidine transporter YuiF (NhaC family)